MSIPFLLLFEALYPEYDWPCQNMTTVYQFPEKKGSRLGIHAPSGSLKDVLWDIKRSQIIPVRWIWVPLGVLFGIMDCDLFPVSILIRLIVIPAERPPLSVSEHIQSFDTSNHPRQKTFWHTLCQRWHQNTLRLPGCCPMRPAQACAYLHKRAEKR